MKLRVVAVVACALVLCLVLAGCAGPDKTKFTGDWNLTSADAENFDKGTLEYAESLGLQVTLSLNEDGTGTFTLLSDKADVTWEISSDTEGKMIIGGTSEATMQLSDGKLHLVDGSGGVLTFSRP